MNMKMFGFKFKKIRPASPADTRKGFFIAELIVATFVFGIVMTVSIGALILAIDANKKNQSLQSVLNNLNVVLDTMTKTLAVGMYYRCDESTYNYTFPHNGEDVSDCTIAENGGTSISFLFNEDLDDDGIANDVINYKFVPDALGGFIARTIYGYRVGGPLSEPIRMTAPEVNITEMKFYVTGSTPVDPNRADFEQPTVLIVVKGTAPAGPRNAPTDFMVQTRVTQRIPDFE